MSLEQFDKIAKTMGLQGKGWSFVLAVEEAAKRNGKIYATREGFQTKPTDKGVQIPLETIQELAKVIGAETGAKAAFLRHSLVKRIWIWLTGVPSANEQHARIYREVKSILYPEYNQWAVRNLDGTPKFLEVFRREDLSRVKKAIDELLENPFPNSCISALFFDSQGRSPLHALALDPQLEGRTVLAYMRELKRLDPNADKLWLQKDSNGISPLSLAVSELNYSVLDYVSNHSELTADEVVQSQDQFVLDLLKCCLKPRSDEISERLKLSGKGVNPFQVKQRIRRMLITAAENYPALFASQEIVLILKDHQGKFPKEILYVCDHVAQLAEAQIKRKEGFKSWKDDCGKFEETVRKERSIKPPKHLLQEVYQRVEDVETILSVRQNALKGLSKRDKDGMSVLQRKAEEFDLPFFKELCNPLRLYDHQADFSDKKLMSTSKGDHLLTLLVKKMDAQPEKSLEIIKLLLSKAPELADQVNIEDILKTTPELYKEMLRNVLDNPFQLAVEKDQLLKTEFYRQQIYRDHLDYLNAILPVLRGDVQLEGEAPRLEKGPRIVQKGEKLNQPKEKKITELMLIVLKSATMIFTIISSLALRVKAGIMALVRSEAAERAEAAAIRVLSTIPQEIARKKMFGDRLICNARNIGSEEVIETKEDQEAAEELYKNFIIQNQKAHLYIGDALKAGEMPWGLLASDSKGWRGVLRSGVCWGAAMDFIHRYQVQGFAEIENMGALYSAGVPASACANQAVYQALNTFPDHPSDLIFSHLELLGRLDGMDPVFKRGLFNADFIVIQKLFAMIMREEIGSANNRILSRDRKLVMERLSQLLEKMSAAHPLIGIISEKLRGSFGLMSDDGSNSVTEFFDALREDWETFAEKNNKLPNESAKGLNILNWLESLLIQQVGYRKILLQERRGLSSGERERQEALGLSIDPRFTEIPDPRLRAFLAQVDATQQSHRIESAVIKMRGLQQNAVHGLPERYAAPTDVDYLRHFNELEDGSYVISFSTKTFQADGAHSICYIKKGEQGYIFDPNPGLIRCKANKHAEDLLELLTVYPMPSNCTSHEIEIRKVSLLR